jgi:ribonucleoside-triphosphate reductase
MSTPCTRDTEVYSRVCGFFRPVQSWNNGKKEEFKERVEFDVKNKPLSQQ